MSASGLWLTGWIMIALHFAAFLFLPSSGASSLPLFLGIAALVWAGLIFMWASVPFRRAVSSKIMMAGLMAVHTLYVGLLLAGPAFAWMLTPAATLYALVPCALALLSLRKLNPTQRWINIVLHSALSFYLLGYQHRPGNGTVLALNGVLFTVYLACGVHFWYGYRRSTAGAFVTVAGFLTWASVFALAPWMQACLPQVQIESEVWNLPKYVVAVGMILLLLEDQIEHNKYLALHDELTDLPNRRLFQDRLASALERARRSGTQTALLLIDLDRFKQVNDTLGHHVGDQLLKRVAGLFLGRVRRTDTVARTGGDEFSVILEEPINRRDAERVGHALIQLLNEPLELDGHAVRVGASVGIAIFPEDALSGESLCIAADLRMYNDKYESRGHAQQPDLTKQSTRSKVQAGLHSEWL